MPDFVPGWTVRGYPDLDGFAWYRLRLHVTGSDHPLIDQSLPGQPLSLKMPQSVDDAYQVYANGRYIGHLGNFSARRVSFTTRSRSPFRCPRRGRMARSNWRCAFICPPPRDSPLRM
jgi:hypothetical protein